MLRNIQCLYPPMKSKQAEYMNLGLPKGNVGNIILSTCMIASGSLWLPVKTQLPVQSQGYATLCCGHLPCVFGVDVQAGCQHAAGAGPWPRDPGLCQVFCLTFAETNLSRKHWEEDRGESHQDLAFFRERERLLLIVF